MSEKLIIYYSVDNCGDGSAYPRLFTTKKLAEWHQDHLQEGWGESCTGEIVIEGKDISCKKLMCEAEQYLKLLLEGYKNCDEITEFKNAFFPDGLPKFTVKIFDNHHYGIYVENRLVFEYFAYHEKKTNNNGVKKLTKQVNS